VESGDQCFEELSVLSEGLKALLHVYGIAWRPFNEGRSMKRPLFQNKFSSATFFLYLVIIKD